ncbi:MAG: glycosyltransferase [Labilithrix sp.]|nr:glycosyltransferase [Labilithrix sp.]
MRVVHLTTEFPWPATSGGPVRTLSQLRIVASLPEVESITLLSVTETGVPASDVRALEGAVAKLRVVPPVFHPIHLFDFKRRVPRVVALRLLGVPYLAGKWDSRELRRTLRRELLASPVDVVYVDHLGMARYLPDILAERPFCRTVLDQHNVESDFFKQFADEARGPKRLVAKAEYARARSFEQRALREVGAVVAISSEDAKHFKTLGGVDAHVVPVVMPFERKARPHPGKPHFCYVGSLRWKPNVLGLDWFCREVWPLVRRRVPDATLEIAGVGLKPDASGRLPVPDAWKGPGIETVGFLEDLEPLYARSLGMIAPITGGSGVRLKLLEGFRAGMPVVTTPDGAFGLPLEDGKEALISPDPAGFAERIARVADDEPLRERLREGGYAFLEAHHSLAVAQRAMRAALGVR